MEKTIFSTFEQHGDKVAVIDEHGVTVSYRTLNARVDDFCARFESGQGLVLLECENTLPALICYIAAIRSRFPVFLIESNRNLEAMKQTFSCLYHYDAKTDTLRTTGPQSDIELHENLAVLLSTSGSTGDQKCVRLSHQNIRSNTQAIVEYLGISETDCAPTTLPMYYSYGLSVINSHLHAGASLFLTSLSIGNPTFWEAFDRHFCSSFAGTPYSYDLLERNNIKTAERPSLRYATQAGGRLDPTQVSHWAHQSASEGWRFFVMYGQTEAAPRMAYLPPEVAERRSDCIGQPIQGGAFHLESEGGGVIHGTNETGELIYQGPNVMMGYALVDADLARGDEHGALRTGDLAQRTTDGYYRIVGRKSRFIKPFGLRINLDAVEVWMTGQGVSGVATRRHEELWVFATDIDNTKDLQALMAAWLGIPATGIQVHQIETIPQTWNGKTDYPALDILIDSAGKVAASRFSWRRLFPFLPTPQNRSVMAVFETHFPERSINPDDTFQGLGGDSLSYINVSIDLESVIGEPPEDWERQSIQSLTPAVLPLKTAYRRLEMSTLLRFLAISLIVAVHFDLMANVRSSGSFLLLMIAGFNFSAFQLNPLSKTGSIRPILWLILKVALPTIAYITMFELYADTFDVRTVLLISNLSPGNAGNGISYWFIELYVQIMIILAVLFSIRPIRHVFHRYPFAASSGFLLLALLTLTLTQTHPGQSDKYPHLLIWVFAIGVSACLASNFREKLFVTVFICAAIFQFGGHTFLIWIALPGAALLIWRPIIHAPWWITRPIAKISGASLFIYLTHFQFRHLLHKVFDVPPVLDMVFVLLAGTVLWTAYNAAFRQIRTLPYVSNLGVRQR